MIKINYCKYKDIPERIIAQITGSNNVSSSLGESQKALPTGCHSFISDMGRVPYNTPVGKYTLQFTVEHQINALRFDEQYQQSEIFEVLDTLSIK